MRDLDPPVDHHHVAAHDAGDGDRAVQDHDLAHDLAAANEHVPGQHDLIARFAALGRDARLGRRRGRGRVLLTERGGRDERGASEDGGHHQDAGGQGHVRILPAGPGASGLRGTVGGVSLDRFSPAVRAWFASTFREPTPAQAQGWPAIAGGRHTLILAPTGSGKTLAAFLWALDRLATEPPPPAEPACRVLYISPLRALAVDVEKNLRAPLAGIELAAERLGAHVHEPAVAMRTGDTPAARTAQARRPGRPTS